MIRCSRGNETLGQAFDWHNRLSNNHEVCVMSLKEGIGTWQESLPLEITSDPLWHCTAYRLALFASDRSWDDLAVLAKDPRTAYIPDQLGRALGSISANYIEAYSRSSSPDRCRFYEYALASTRESRDWYFKARRVIGMERLREALELLTRIARLLTTTIVNERNRAKRRTRKNNVDA
jgi:four helix bundle protein